MNMKVVDAKYINKSAIKLLESILDQAKSGEVVAVTVVSEMSDTTYTLSASSSASRVATAGMLLDSAIKRLGYKDEN